MYYKSSNKTILISTLVALMCIWTHAASSQNLSGDEQTVEAPAPVSEDVVFEIEDDIIPLNDDELIVPEQKQEVVVVTQSDDGAEQETVSENSEDGAEPEVEEKVEPETKSEAQPQQVSAPKEDISDDFMDDFEISFDDEATDKPQDLFEEAPVQQNDKPQQAPDNNDAKVKDVNAPLKPQASNNLKFGDSILAQTNNDLFNQMSDIEKQTTLLTLELKRERVRNEVEAARAVREKAEREKIAQEEEKARQAIEWKKEQEVKVLKAQEELKQKEIELEKIRQQKALTAYMNSMLEQKQSWIAENGKLYDEIRNLKDTNTSLRSSYKGDMEKIQAQSDKLVKDAEIARNNYERAVASLSAQNAQLRKRMESMEQNMKNNAANANPFADKPATAGNQITTSADTLIKPMNVAKEYAIMEITGQGDELFVKLINKEGDSFVAKVGTVLQTGHMVEEITPHYVQFDRNGLKDFLYTANSALSMEPNKMTDEEAQPSAANTETLRPRATLISDDTLPSVGDSMFIK